MSTSLDGIGARPDWWDGAACNTTDGTFTPLFFAGLNGAKRPTEASNPAERRRYAEARAQLKADVARAKGICVGCPVQATCLAGALARRETMGVWGGFNFASANDRGAARVWLAEATADADAA